MDDRVTNAIIYVPTLKVLCEKACLRYLQVRVSVRPSVPP